MPGTYIPIQMAFQLPSGLSIAAQVWGSPPLRDDETDPDPSSRSLRRINIIAGHGQLDNSNTWKKMIPYFMDTLLSAAGGARVSVVAIDYLGHGLSDHRLPDADYGRHKWAEDTIRVMDKLGWKKAALLAHSAGGEASTVAAVAFPDRITHLMLLDSDGPAPRAARAIPLETASFIRRRLRAPSKKTVFQTREEAIMRRARGNPIDGTIGIEASQILCERSLAEVVKDGRKVGYMWRTDQELMGNRPGNPTPETCLAFVKRVRCPTLILAGTEGRVIKRNPPDSEHIKAFNEACGGRLSYVVVKGNHHAHLTTESGAKQCGEEAGRWLGTTIDAPISTRKPAKSSSGPGSPAAQPEKLASKM